MSVAYVLDEIFLEHRPPGPHPERPERLLAIREALLAIGLEERARRLPLRDGSVAGLFVNASMLHVPFDDVERTLAEFRRVLAGRGAVGLGAADLG